MLSPTTFTTFDRSIELEGLQQQPDRYRQLEMISPSAPRIARGGGLSYVAASFAKGVIAQRMTSFNRFLAYTPGSSVRVEAGMTLAKLTEFAGRHRMHLPVLPGHPGITVGGCIAADAHGKNPARDGTFCDWVEALTIFHCEHGFRQITRQTGEQSFELTCGGLGLTGIIVDATLRLTPAGGAALRVTRSPCRSLEQAAELLDQARQHEFAYSWHDGSARGASFGRGLIVVGDWVEGAESADGSAERSAEAGQRTRLPFSIWTKGTTRLVNSTYLHWASRRPAVTSPIQRALFPLAGAPAYFDAFGRRGMVEVQLLIPDVDFPAFVRSLRRLVDKLDPTLVLMSLKRFRARVRGCTLGGEGILIAFNLPRDDSAATRRFLDELDALAVDVKAQPNVMKDGRITERTARGSLPNYESFARRLAQYDLGRRYQSALSRRLGL